MLKTLLSTDAYKIHHKDQYPEGIELIFANITPRHSNHNFIQDKIVVFGVKYVLDKLTLEWKENFFDLNEVEVDEALEEYSEFIRSFFNVPEFNTEHLKELWLLDELPIEFRYISDYSIVSLKTPILTLWNTDKRFAWLVNYLETYLLNSMWQIVTSANVSHIYHQLFKSFQKKTHNDVNFIDWQGHDFSYRGLSSRESAVLSGLGHLAFFNGTDTVPAALEYKNFIDENKIVGSVFATEHSVMSAAGKENEFETYERLLDQYPNGILSIVSDTWNLWKVIDEYLPKLKDKILSRNGKLVIRPDSGDHIEVCMHLIAKLDQIFGSTINSKGFKELNSKIGIIFGDSLTLQKAKEILETLFKMGYASNNIVFGIGASSYQGVTRDTLGFAMKTTYVEVNGIGSSVFKDPITDSGIKRSAKGILNVRNGELIEETTFAEIEKESDFKKYFFVDYTQPKIHFSNDENNPDYKELKKEVLEVAALNKLTYDDYSSWNETEQFFYYGKSVVEVTLDKLWSELNKYEAMIKKPVILEGNNSSKFITDKLELIKSSIEKIHSLQTDYKLKKASYNQ